MKNLLKLIFLFITFYSCHKQEGFDITGNVTGFPDSTMFYLRNLSTDEIIDSGLVIGNKFRLAGHLQDAPEQFWLNTRIDGEFVYAFLLIGNEEIVIEGDIKDFPWDVKITGSSTQDVYNVYKDLTKSYSKKRDSLVQSYFKLPPGSQDEKGKPIWDEINNIDDTVHSIRMGFVKSYLNTYQGLIELGYLKKSFPKDTVQSFYNGLSDELKTSKYAKVINMYLNEKIIEVGDPFYDFKAFSNSGDTVTFSNLIGKYILLDFTSAYCGPCIQSVEDLHIMDKTFKDSLKIVSFCTDPKKEFWETSLSRDSVTWLSLWDGKGRYGETYLKYGIQGVPSFFLIDPKGKIIDKWTGYGKGSLISKLERFKNN